VPAYIIFALLCIPGVIITTSFVKPAQMVAFAKKKGLGV